MVRSTLVYEGSKGTDDSRKTVRRQEIAMKGVGKEDTLKIYCHHTTFLGK